MSATIEDQPGLEVSSFSATLVQTPGSEMGLEVKGNAVGDYRVNAVQLVRARHQPASHVLHLDLIATFGKVENPHSDIEKVMPVQYTEQPARHRYTQVKITSGSQHVTMNVVDVL